MSDDFEDSNGGEGPNRRQLLAILEANGFKVHESDIRYHLPVAISHKGFENLEDKGVKALDGLVQVCESYLSGVFIEDDFGNTLEGRQARTTLWSRLAKDHPGIAAIQMQDKLKMGSSIGSIKAFFEWFVTELDADSVRSFKANKARELYRRFLAVIPFTEKDRVMTIKAEYVQLPFEQKMAVARDIDAVLREFLGLVAMEGSGRKVDRAG